MYVCMYVCVCGCMCVRVCSYKTVRLQVERGDARVGERVKALRLIFVELGDERFLDCPIDLRAWLRQTQLEQKQRNEASTTESLHRHHHHGHHLRHQQPVHRTLVDDDEHDDDGLSPLTVRSAAGTKLIGNTVEQKLDAPLGRAPSPAAAAATGRSAGDKLLESPVHSDGSDSEDMFNTSDIFAISADSTNLAAQLRRGDGVGHAWNAVADNHRPLSATPSELDTSHPSATSTAELGSGRSNRKRISSRHKRNRRKPVKKKMTDSAGVTPEASDLSPVGLSPVR